MPSPARKFALSLALGLAATIATSLDTGSAVAQSCDPSYPDFCIPPPYEIGDLDCVDISATAFRVFQPDPHYFDDDLDGLGCEWS
jgi:micrococcal nuclease